MDFRSGNERGGRAEVREFLDLDMSLALEEQCTAPVSPTTGIHPRPWWSRVGWRRAGPSSSAARGSTPRRWWRSREELRLADAPMYGIGTTMMVGRP